MLLWYRLVHVTIVYLFHCSHSNIYSLIFTTSNVFIVDTVTKGHDGEFGFSFLATRNLIFQIFMTLQTNLRGIDTIINRQKLFSNSVINYNLYLSVSTFHNHSYFLRDLK